MPRPSKSRASARPRSKMSAPWWWIFALFLILAAVGVTTMRHKGWHAFMDGQHRFQIAQKIELTGSVHFTALKPDPEDKGELKIMVRELHEEAWTVAALGVPLKQDAMWKWKSALPGENYEFQAVLVIDGKEVKKSEIELATAPAYDVVLPLSVTWKDLPDDVVAGSTTVLGGSVAINGYIPQGAQLQVIALNASDYDADGYSDIDEAVVRRGTVLATVANPKAMEKWSWNKAIPLTDYIVVAVLRNRGMTLDVSQQIIKAEASEESLEHTINSTIQPPQTSQTNVLGVNTIADAVSQVANQAANAVGVSGVVTLQGPKQKNTSLLVLWRKPGENQYNVVNRYMYPAHQGTKWNWTGGTAGQSYEFTAALQVDDNNTSTAPHSLTVTAPATGVNFDLNTYYVMPKTESQPVNEVCIDKSGDQSTAVIRLPQVANAAQYWLQVGTDSGQSGVYNQMVPATQGQDTKIQVRVQNGKQNFMRYSYATCVNCSSTQDFAPNSPEVAFTCS